MKVVGKELASEILEEVRLRTEQRATPLALHIVSVGATPATLSYLAIKRRAAGAAGITFSHHAFTESAHLAELQLKIEALSEEVTALVVQLPLPSHISTDAALQLIPKNLDADVLSPQSYAAFINQSPHALVPPVAAAVATILKHHDVSPLEKNVVVVGAGRLVGMPVAAWFAQQGAHVTQLNEHSFASGLAALATADIVVTGVGKPFLITPTMIKPGVVLIDAGTSEYEGCVVGDTDSACAEVASLYAPVPGGVGPIAVACLMQNVLKLAVRHEFTQ